MKQIASLVALFIFSFSVAQSNDHSHMASRSIDFPDVPGFKTLVCDFHQHTVFSDGSVWPSIRVQEAIKDGIDAISLTEHLEYQPHKKDIPHPDRNRSYEIAQRAAKNKDLLVISGSEITRSMPPGHSNAIFVTDSNKLLHEDAMTVFKEAKNQGAFVFWNHPNWISQVKTGIASLTPMHETLIAENLLQGIEVVNEDTYSDEALQIALDNDLTIMGTSDIHGLIDWQYKVPEGGHRPVTLVFASERSEVGIKEALFANRTAVYFNNTLIGRNEHILPLIESSLIVKKAKYIGKTTVLEVAIENLSDMDYLLINNSDFTFHKHADIVDVHGGTTTIIQIKTITRLESIELSFDVLNAVIAPNAHPELKFQFTIE